MAQARNKPARIELSRLTVRQYRNAVADLVGSFRPPASPGEERGLRGEYFKSRRFRNNDRLLERVDPKVAFDFGDGSPEPEKIEAAEFAIRWEGSACSPRRRASTSSSSAPSTPPGCGSTTRTGR